MSKSLKERVLRIERLRGSGKFLIGVREPGAYKGVKVNGSLMTDRQFQVLSELQGGENIEVFGKYH